MVQQIVSIDQASRSIQIIWRCAPLLLAILFAAVVALNLFRAGQTALLCARLLFTLSLTVYVAVRLLLQREKEWSWSGRAEAWCAAKACTASAAGYCRRNYTLVTYYVVIVLYGTALLFTDGGANSRYGSVVSIIAPALIAIAKVVSYSRGDRGRGSQEQTPQLSVILCVAADQRAEEFIS